MRSNSGIRATSKIKFVIEENLQVVSHEISGFRCDNINRVRFLFFPKRFLKNDVFWKNSGNCVVIPTLNYNMIGL